MEYREFTGKTVDDAITEALIALETTSDKLEYEVVQEPTGGLFGILKKEAVIKARKAEEEKDELADFLEKLLAGMEVEGTVDIKVDDEEKTIDIEIGGEDTGDIIGKRGQTLDAIQYLAGIIANKDRDEYYRVKVDTKNYRERRQKTLENLAKNIASKVKKTRHKVVLEPMNPYERRIIHSYLQDDKFVTTKSEGEEPNRRVVVYYNK
ncbi:MAG: protein jag [Parasporobacterium sp.]|nr:protein jag [Parasporobacterium sp.]